MSEQAQSLQALRQQWTARWAAMAPRERMIITTAVWLAALALLVMLGIRPAWRTLRDTPVQLRELNAQLDQMRRLADESQALRQRPPVPPAQAGAALKAATERLGAGASLAPQGDRATLTLTKVSGDALASWLQEVRAASRAKPIEANLSQVGVGYYTGTVTVALNPGATR